MKATVLFVIILSLFQASCVSSTYPIPKKKTITKRYKDGSIIKVSRSGKVVKEYKDGSKTVIHPAGEVSKIYKDGSIAEIHPAGEVSKIYKDGSIAEIRPDGEVVKEYKDGSKAERHPASKVRKKKNSRSVNSSSQTCKEQVNKFFACLRKTVNNISCEQFAIWGLIGGDEQSGILIGQVCLQENTLPDFKKNCQQEIYSEFPKFMKKILSSFDDRCE